MLWLDGLLALPGIGIRTKPNHKLLGDFRDSILGFVDHLSKDTPELDIKAKDLWGYSISSKVFKFSFEISPKSITAFSRYWVKQRLQPGKLPGFQVPEIETFSELMEQTHEYIKKIFDAIKDVKGFHYDRIGVVVDMNLDEESLPPGVVSWINALSKPLGGHLIHSEISLLALLVEEDKYRDQCHHVLKFDENVPEKGFGFRLDWQRLYKKPVLLDHTKIQKVIGECKDKAIEYFTKFGEGELDNG